MDYDVLERIADCVTKGILRQDTTDYWETLDTDAILIINTNPQRGDIRSAVAQMAQVWDDNIELKRRQLEATLQSNKTLLTSERQAEEEKIRQMVNRPKIELSDLDGLGEELARGAENVGRATLSVFEWMQKWASKTGGIAMPASRQEVRRPPKVAANRSTATSSTSTSTTISTMGASGFGAAARQQKLREEAVKAQQEAAAAGRTLEGKLNYSSIYITYGLPHMLVRDELYVHEEGKVVLVVRTCLPPEEGYYPEIIRARDLAVVDPTGGGTAPATTTATGFESSISSGRRSLSPRSTSNNSNNNTSTTPRGSSPRSLLLPKNSASVNNNNNTGNSTALVIAAGGKQNQVSFVAPSSTSLHAGGSSLSPRGVAKHSTTGSATNKGSRVLDFSFKKITAPYDLLRTEPTNFVRHLAAPVAKEAPKNLADEIRSRNNGKNNNNNNDGNKDGRLGNGKDGSGQNKFIKIGARRRDGEIERYGFSSRDGKDDDGFGFGLMGEANKNNAVNPEFEQLVNNLRTKVVCDSVRLCNNEISAAADLLPVLRNLVVNHYLRVRWLDLSNNNLKAIPAEISQMPLQALHLHGNQIESWKSLEDELPKLTRLQHFTIFGNPIAENASTFRPRALGLLLHVPFKLLPFKALDFVPLTLVDVQSAAAYLRTNPRALDITAPERVLNQTSPSRKRDGNSAGNNNTFAMHNSVY